MPATLSSFGVGAATEATAGSSADCSGVVGMLNTAELAGVVSSLW